MTDDSVTGDSVNRQTPRPTRRVAGIPVVRLAVGAVALIYAILFITFNTSRVRIHFVFFTVTTHLWVGLLVCLIIGGLVGEGARGLYRRRAKRSSASS